MTTLKSRFREDKIIEIGIDEAGRGSFWGPLMAGAVIIPNESEWTDNQRVLLLQLRDSKKLSPKKREKLANDIKELLPYTSVGIVNADEINKHGITWANMEAFRRAIIGLNYDKNISGCRLIIDGVLSIEKWDGEQNLIVEGDSQYLAIAGASILAKVEHDRWIKEYCKEHPDCAEKYDLIKCNGYGTAKHREGIKMYGGHELHRELYIQNWLPGTTPKPKPKSIYKKKTDGECLIKFN
jgi:ribonuclease HII